jgi:ribosomal subunit interface protein
VRKLEGKTAIITCAVGGIGAATAKRFVHEGASVILVDRDEDALARLHAELGSRTRSELADVASAPDTIRCVHAVIHHFGGLDILFANAQSSRYDINLKCVHLNKRKDISVMTEHLQVTFRHMPVSAALRELIHDQAGKLLKRYEGIGHCHVVIDAAPVVRSVRNARFTRVAIDIGGPHGHLSASCSHEDAYAAVRDTFSTLARQVERRSMRAAG